METRSYTTTSVSTEQTLSFNANEFLGASRGRAAVADAVDLTPRFIKKLATSVQESYPASADEYDLYGYEEDTDDAYEYDTHDDSEASRKMGRGALRSILGLPKWIDRQAAYYSGKFLTRASQEEREAHEAKYAPSDDDSWLQRRIKAIKRNKYNIYDRAIPYTMGALAMSKVMPYAVDFGIDVSHDVADKIGDFKEYLEQPRTVVIGQDLAANAIDYTPVERTYDSKAIMIGGRGDTSGIFLYNALDVQGGVAGTNHLVENPAGIAPVDPVRMDISAAIAADGATNYYNPNDPSQQTIYGYSEGSAGAIDAYNQILADNGGVKPANLELILLGSPYAEGGFFKSDYAQVAGPVLDAMGIPVDKEVPAGATVIYSPNDFWANGDNQSFLGMMSQMADLGGSGHDPSVTGEFYEKIDENGVRHLIKAGTEHALVELAEKQGMPLPEGTSAILQQVAPINNGFSEEVPQPNAYAAVDMTGDLINRETNSNIGTAFTDNVPQEWQDLGQSSLVAVNNIPNTVAGMANGQIPLDQGLREVDQQVKDVINDVQVVLEDPIGTGVDMIQNSIQDAVPPEAKPFVDPWLKAFFPPR